MRSRILTRWAVGGGLIALLLVIVTLGFLVRGRGDDGTLKRVQATGELRVGLDASFPPFESLDADGNIVGIDADLAQAIAAALGAEPVFVNVGFDGLSQPYFNAGQVLVVRADDEAFTSSSGIPMPGLLSGLVVAVEWGSLADMEARRLKQTAEGMETLPQPTAQGALNALVAGQADAAIADAVSAYQFIGESDERVRIAEVLTDEPYVIATRVKSRRLAGAIDDALAELRESGALDELMGGWF
jgi:polar amino acid transport system substrate-binding protein